MTKRLESKYKINRRYGVNMWGRAKSPVNVREYGPGQHGQRVDKISNYGHQLAAKQKLRGYYGSVTELQMRRLYKEADSKRGNTGEFLLGFLESRLDAVVYRLKFAPTVFSARQIVNHGHILVNGKRVNIPSYRVKVGDEVKVVERMHTNVLIASGVESAERAVPDYLACESKELSGKVLRIPSGAEIPYPFDVQIRKVVEWYSSRA